MRWLLACLLALNVTQSYVSDYEHLRRLKLDHYPSSGQLRRSYRKAALRWHPDKHQQGNSDLAARRFREVREAYEALKFKCGAQPRPASAPRRHPPPAPPPHQHSHRAQHPRKNAAGVGNSPRGSFHQPNTELPSVSRRYTASGAVQLFRSPRAGKSTTLRVVHVFSERQSDRVAQMFDSAATAMGSGLVQWCAVEIVAVRQDPRFAAYGISSDQSVILMILGERVISRLNEHNIATAAALSSWVADNAPHHVIKLQSAANYDELMQVQPNGREHHLRLLLITKKSKLSLLFKALSLKYKGVMTAALAQYPQNWIQRSLLWCRFGQELKPPALLYFTYSHGNWNKPTVLRANQKLTLSSISEFIHQNTPFQGVRIRSQVDFDQFLVGNPQLPKLMLATNKKEIPWGFMLLASKLSHKLRCGVVTHPYARSHFVRKWAPDYQLPAAMLWLAGPDIPPVLCPQNSLTRTELAAFVAKHLQRQDASPTADNGSFQRWRNSQGQHFPRSAPEVVHASTTAARNWSDNMRHALRPHRTECYREIVVSTVDFRLRGDTLPSGRHSLSWVDAIQQSQLSQSLGVEMGHLPKLFAFRPKTLKMISLPSTDLTVQQSQGEQVERILKFVQESWQPNDASTAVSDPSCMSTDMLY